MPWPKPFVLFTSSLATTALINPVNPMLTQHIDDDGFDNGFHPAYSRDVAAQMMQN